MVNSSEFVSRKNYFAMWALHFVIKIFFELRKLFRFKGKTNNKKILFIELGHLGDVLMATNPIRIVRNEFKDSEIMCLCSASGAAALKNNLDINEVVVIDSPLWYEKNKRKNIIKLLKAFLCFIKTIKKLDARTVVNFRNTSYHLDHIAVWIAGVSNIIGFGNKGLDFLLEYSGISNKNTPIPIQKIILINEWLKLTSSNGRIENKPLFFPAILAKESIVQLMLFEGINLTDEIIIINPGAQHNHLWPIESFVEVCITLNSYYPHLKILFTGLKEHKSIITDIISKLSFKTYSLAGITSLDELFVLLHYSKILLTVDTGIRHLANAASIPIVVLRSGAEGYQIFGKYTNSEIVLTHYLSCSPCGESICPLGTLACMKGILPVTVFEAIKSIGKINKKEWLLTQ